MDACLIMVLIFAILIVGIIAVIIITRKPKLLAKATNRNLSTFRQELINKLKNQNYEINEKENGNIFVKKDTFSATTLVLKQEGADVDVLFIHSNTPLLLAIIIICIFTVWIVGIILALIADINSKSFRNNELIPLISGDIGDEIYCASCGRLIPADGKICPYCGKQLVENIKHY